MEELIKSHGLEDLAEEILAISKPCVVGTACDEAVRPCDSKVGGNPHAPAAFEWPCFRDEPLEFVAQINCAAIPFPDLPNKGLFFYDSRRWGHSPKDEGSIQVFYYPDLEDIREVPAPQIRRQ